MAEVTTSKPPARVRRSGSQRIRSVLGWLILLFILGIWWFALRPVELGGPASIIVVSGDSMEPNLSDGDLVVLHKQDEYSIGDVVTFAVPEGEPGAGSLIIHRLIGTEEDAFVPQGDNRDRPDEWRPTWEDIRGTLWIRLPGAGRLLIQAIQPPIIAAFAGGVFTMWFLLREKPEISNSMQETDTSGE